MPVDLDRGPRARNAHRAGPRCASDGGPFLTLLGGVSRPAAVSDVAVPADHGLAQRLAARAAAAPDADALIRLDAGGERARVESSASLAAHVADLAAGMRERGWVDERVVLAVSDEADFACAFLACLWSGVIAVPAITPGTVRNNERLTHYAADSTATAVLVDEWAGRQLRLRAGANGLGAPVVELSSLAAGTGCAVAHPDPDSPAYLQYTSGSTRAPKGVIITHRNLAAQLAVMRQPVQPGEALVNPMPLYHDFGLVMCLHALACGGSLVLLPAQYAIRDPYQWLRAISAYRAVLSASAPFLLDLCTQRIDEAERRALDLSSVRALWIGGEPIPPATVHGFRERFEPCGLPPTALGPGYGLAEATMTLSSAVAGPVIGRYSRDGLRHGRARPASDGQELVSCGQAFFADSLRIVSADDGTVRPGREVGELWVRAPTVSPGYWQRPEASRETMDNRLTGETGRWLRTGDLAFIDDGELFVMGRISDTVIVRGENRYPQDIEWAVIGAHPAISHGGVAAFSVADEGPETLVLVCEIRRAARRKLQHDDVFRSVRRALAEQQGLVAERMVLIPEAGLPRTSSGKLSRQGARAAYEQGRMKVIAEWQAPPEPAAAGGDESLLGLCRRLLQMPDLGADDVLFDHGLDSLRAAELMLEIEQRFGLRLNAAELDERVSVNRIAAAIETGEWPDNGSTAAHPPARKAFVAGRSARLQSYTASWDAPWRSPNRLAFGMNLEGSKPPLAWCFQGFHEFRALAEWLGPDQPLFGLRSAHYVADYNDRDMMAGLAAIYLEELAAAPGGLPQRLGGNCQGAVVAVAMARQLLEAGTPPAALFLLEDIAARVDPRPLPVPVALMYGEHSREINPYRLFPDPRPGWDKLYPAGYSVDLIDAGHGGYFRKPGIESLSARLAARLAEAPNNTSAPPAAEAPISQADARAEIAVDTGVPQVLEVATAVTLDVRVTDHGERTWRPEDRLIVGNHWLSQDEEVVRWLDGYTALATPLAPGACVALELTVTAPPEAGNYLLELDVAEQGVAWFAERGNQPLRLPIRVVRSASA